MALCIILCRGRVSIHTAEAAAAAAATATAATGTVCVLS